MLTAILGTLVIGLIVGAIAKFLMPGPDPGGCLLPFCSVLPARLWPDF